MIQSPKVGRVGSDPGSHLREGVFGVLVGFFCFQKCLAFPPWVSINGFFAVHK